MSDDPKTEANLQDTIDALKTTIDLRNERISELTNQVNLLKLTLRDLHDVFNGNKLPNMDSAGSIRLANQRASDVLEYDLESNKSESSKELLNT